MKDDLGRKIKKARRDVGMSQRELAEELKVSDKTISAYEVGRATPSFRTIKKISRIVHKPIAYFDEEDNADVDLQIKLKTIERELLEVKKLLKKRNR